MAAVLPFETKSPINIRLRPKPRSGYGTIVAHRCLFHAAFGESAPSHPAEAASLGKRVLLNWLGFLDSVVSKTTWSRKGNRLASMMACVMPSAGFEDPREGIVNSCKTAICPFCWSRWVCDVWSAVDYACFPDVQGVRATTSAFSLTRSRRNVGIPGNFEVLAARVVAARLSPKSTDAAFSSRSVENNGRGRVGSVETMYIHPDPSPKGGAGWLAEAATLFLTDPKGPPSRVPIHGGESVTSETIKRFDRKTCARFVGSAFAYPNQIQAFDPKTLDQYLHVIHGKKLRARYGSMRRGYSRKRHAPDGSPEWAEVRMDFAAADPGDPFMAFVGLDPSRGPSSENATGPADLALDRDHSSGISRDSGSAGE